MKHGACLAALLLAGCTTLPGAAPTITGLAPGSAYVALGSSYAAGANVPPAATDRPARCGASRVSYARLLAAELDLDLTDASCGGATTEHLLAPWNELPAQVDAVTERTRLVTVTVGGNDLNYMGFMFAGSCLAGVGDPRNPNAATCRTVPLPDEAALTKVEGNLKRLFAEVRRRAPQARIVLVQYVALVGEEPCAAAPLPPGYAAQARDFAARLAQASARAATSAGVDILPVDRLSVGHTSCSPQPWSRGLAPEYDGSAGAPWHPTAEGHAAIARALAALLRP